MTNAPVPPERTWETGTSEKIKIPKSSGTTERLRRRHTPLYECPHRPFWDQTSLLGGLIGISVPHFLLGPLLVLFFSVELDLLPISGRREAWSFLLPSLTLGSGMAAILTRMTRSSMLETLSDRS